MKTNAEKAVPQRRRISGWLIIPGVLVGLMILAYAVIALLFTIYFFPVPTGLIAPHVYAIHDGIADLFLITDGRTWIAVDAGQHPQVIAAEMKKFKISPDNVSAVLLTHSDYDHTGGLTALSNAEIYLSDKEEPLVTHKVARKSGYYNKPLPRPYRLLHDGEILSFGKLKVRAVATPGHTPGSTAYVVNGDMLFTGDTLALTRDGKVRLSYKIHNVDTKTEQTCIHKLAKLKGLRWIFNPHTGISNNPVGAFAGW